MARTLPVLDSAPFVAFLVLLEVAVGTRAISHLIDILGGVGRGYAGTTALICAVIAGLALVLGVNLPLSGPAVQSMLHWSIAFLVAITLDSLFAAVGTEVARRVVGSLVVAVGVVAVFHGALVIAPDSPGATAVALLAATIVSGAVWAGMLLGHWYLIAPNLSFKPLRQSVWIIFGAVAIQAVVVLVAVGRAANRADLLSGGDAVLFWLLVVGAGLLFTAAVTGLTWYFARIRANQPATAMLYVLIITALMGTVPAHLLLLRTGIAI